MALEEESLQNIENLLQESSFNTTINIEDYDSVIGFFLNSLLSTSSPGKGQKKEAKTLTKEQIGDLSLDIENSGKVLNSLITEVPFFEKPPYIKIKIKKYETYSGELTTLASLLENNNSLFDSILYLRTRNKEKIKIGVADTKHKPPSPSEYETSFLIIYLLLMVRGVIPEEYEPLPEFVTPLIGDTSINKHRRRVSSFEIKKMDISWIKKINAHHFGEETRKHLKQNISGYRQLAVFSQIKPKTNLTERVKTPYEAVVNYYSKGPTWDMHPLTRTESCILEIGNLNQNVINLVFKVYTEDEIQGIKNRKLIPPWAEYDRSVQEFWWWNEDTFKPFTDYIFKEE